MDMHVRGCSKAISKKKNEHTVPMLIATFSGSIVPGLMSDIYH